MNYILAYFSVGVLFNLLVDMLVDYMEKREIGGTDNMRLDIFGKIVTTLLWPFAIIIILYAVIKDQRN